MRTSILLAAGLGLTTVPALAQTGAPDAQLAFRPGERLAFAVGYGPLPAGEMTLEVQGLGTYEGRPAYHFVFEVESNAAVSVIYELESTEEAWFDAERLRSLRYKRTSIENDKHRTRDYTFDHERNLILRADGDPKQASPGAIDQLSMFYYLRLLPYEPGARFTLRNLADPDDNPLGIRVLKKERVRVPAGTFDTYELELDLKTDSGVFKKGGENRLWVTTDDRHLPVKLSSKIGLGHFVAQLVEHEPGDPVASAALPARR